MRLLILVPLIVVFAVVFVIARPFGSGEINR